MVRRLTETQGVLRRILYWFRHEMGTRREAFCDLGEINTTVAKGPVINIHRLSKGNTGDIESSPTFYFFPQATRNDVRGYNPREIPRDANLIIGGGGLFRENWYPKLQWLIENTRRSVIWGAGTNDGKTRVPSLPAFLKKMSLVGVRDYGLGHEWVPCASCMNKLFDVPRTPKHAVIRYEYKRAPIAIDELPRLTNYDANFAAVLDYLGSGETIITSSYHGMYWGLLLNRKVLVCNPTSSKFFTMKYPVPVCTPENWREAVRRQTSYSEALGECRAANISFAKRVAEHFAS